MSAFSSPVARGAGSPEHGRQRPGGSHHVGCRAHRRHDGDAPGTRRQNLGSVTRTDPADAHYRQRRGSAHRAQAGQACGAGTGFGGRGPHGHAEIRGTEPCRPARLLRVLHANPQHHARAQERFSAVRLIVLAEVNTVRADGNRDLKAIVHDEQHACRVAGQRQIGSQGQQITVRQSGSAKLYRIGPAQDRRSRHLPVPAAAKQPG